MSDTIVPTDVPVGSLRRLTTHFAVPLTERPAVAVCAAHLVALGFNVVVHNTAKGTIEVDTDAPKEKVLYAEPFGVFTNQLF